MGEARQHKVKGKTPKDTVASSRVRRYGPYAHVPRNRAQGRRAAAGASMGARRVARPEPASQAAGARRRASSAGKAAASSGGRSAVRTRRRSPSAPQAAAQGRWYVGARREHRGLTRAHAHAVRAVLASTPDRRVEVKAAVHKSMQGNRGKDTKPEMLVRKRLRAAGLVGYRLQWHVAGRPDIAYPSKKVAIFVNGCFWHRCPHCNLPMPKSHQEFWKAKFDRNVARDRKNVAALEADGWHVHVIWECQLKKDAIDGTFDRLLPQLREELGA